MRVLRTSGGNGGYTWEVCAYLSLIPFSVAGGTFFFPPMLSTCLFPVLAGVLPVFAPHTELQNLVQLCLDGENSTGFQNLGLVPDPATEAP